MVAFIPYLIRKLKNSIKIFIKKLEFKSNIDNSVKHMAQPLLLALTIKLEEGEKDLNEIKFWNYNISKGLLIGFRNKMWNWEFKN